MLVSLKNARLDARRFRHTAASFGVLGAVLALAFLSPACKKDEPPHPPVTSGGGGGPGGGPGGGGDSGAEGSVPGCGDALLFSITKTPTRILTVAPDGSDNNDGLS